MERVDVVILAAGLGSRLGSTHPKCLNLLPDGRSILAHQIDNIRVAFGMAANIVVVTGFECQAIMRHAPSVTFAYNERYAETNTNRSLLRGMTVTGERDLYWMNGDVVFDSSVLARLHACIDTAGSAIAVNTARVAEEEIKYTVDDGAITGLSKTIPLTEALGEAVGVNALTQRDRAVVIEHLARCADQDYFERGLETAVEAGELRLHPVDVTDLYAVEVDTREDLAHARHVYTAARQGDCARGLPRQFTAADPADASSVTRQLT